MANDSSDKNYKAMGVSRMSDNEKAILVHFTRRLTDDELRDLHELLAGRALKSATTPKLPEMFKWWRDRFDDIEDDARTLMKSAPQELHGAIEGIRVVAEQGRDGMERLSRGE